MKRACILLFIIAATVTIRTADDYPSNYVGATLVRLNDNGAWSWFMDPRVIVNDGKLIVGSEMCIRDSSRQKPLRGPYECPALPATPASLLPL